MKLHEIKVRETGFPKTKLLNNLYIAFKSFEHDVKYAAPSNGSGIEALQNVEHMMANLKRDYAFWGASKDLNNRAKTLLRMIQTYHESFLKHVRELNKTDDEYDYVSLPGHYYEINEGVLQNLVNAFKKAPLVLALVGSAHAGTVFDTAYKDLNQHVTPRTYEMYSKFLGNIKNDINAIEQNVYGKAVTNTVVEPSDTYLDVLTKIAVLKQAYEKSVSAVPQNNPKRPEMQADLQQIEKIVPYTPKDVASFASYASQGHEDVTLQAWKNTSFR